LPFNRLANGNVVVHVLKETQFKGDFHHISEVIVMPVVMFDRVTNEILCDKVIIDDKWLLMKQCKPYR
jgi:LacI family transcriptional regulator